MPQNLPASFEFNTKAFDQLKKILKRYENSMKVLAEGPGVYYLAYRAARQEEAEDEDMLFAALVARKTGLHLYLSSLEAFPGFRDFIPFKLIKYLSDDGLKFQFRDNITNMIADIEQLIKLSVGIL